MPADNVTLAISTGTVNDAIDATSFVVNSYAVQFGVMGATSIYGIADNENEAKDVTTLSVSYGAGLSLDRLRVNLKRRR